MAKKLETKKLVAGMEKLGRETKKAIWEDLAQRLQSPSRSKIVVDLEKLNLMAKNNKGKTLVVPGKVLSDGELTEKVTIVAVAASKTAKEKINKKGEFIELRHFLAKASKLNASDLVIVK